MVILMWIYLNKVAPKYSQFFLKYSVYLQKITAGDTMGLHVNILLPPPYKLAMDNFSVLL